MLSMNESAAVTVDSRAVAVYKGLKVTVYTVDKTEISLSRSDLIELINVCISFICFMQSFIHFCMFISVLISVVKSISA